jgi:subtilisin family serine protease/uncharacterized lipoprotein YbaY
MNKISPWITIVAASVLLAGLAVGGASGHMDTNPVDDSDAYADSFQTSTLYSPTSHHPATDHSPTQSGVKRIQKFRSESDFELGSEGDIEAQISSNLLRESDQETVIVNFERTVDTDRVDLTKSELIEKLKTDAKKNRAEFIEYAKSNPHIKIKNKFWITNSVLISVDRTNVSLAQIGAIDKVERIEKNQQVSVLGKPLGKPPSSPTTHDETDISVSSTEPDFTNAIEHIRVDEVWDAYESRGEGVRVSVIDTGVDDDHPDIDIKDGNWKCYIDCSGKTGPHDVDGHGTHTSGTIVGGNANNRNIQIGIAPEATLLHAKAIGDDGAGTVSAAIEAMQWSVTNNADIISMSLGVSYKSEPLLNAVQNANSAGVVVVAAIGNNGVGTSTSPGNIYDSVSVGSSEVSSRWSGDFFDAEDDEISDFSGGEVIETDSDWEFEKSWSPSRPPKWPDQYTVPDVTAPGESIISANAGSNDLWAYQGTSMAAPHVSGVIALKMSNSDTDLSPDKIESLIESSTDDIGYSSNRQGHGRIDAYEAVSADVGELKVQDFDAPTNVTKGEEIRVSADIAHSGDVELTQNIEFFIEGRQVDSQVVTVGSGDQPVSFTYTVPAGEAADTLTTKIETADDTSTADISVLEVGELSVTDFNAPTDARLGEEITVTAEISHSGDVELTQDVIFNIDGTQEGSREVTLDSGTQSISFSYTIPARETADAITTAIKTKDDAASSDVAVLEMGELSVEDVSVPDNATRGEEITISADISHSGDFELSQDVMLGVSAPVDEYPTKEVSLASGERTVSFTYTIPEYGVVDPFSVQISTENDSDDATIDIVEAGELAVRNIRAPADVKQGEEITVSADISHSGDLEVTQDVELRVAGTTEASQEVTLASGDQSVSFTYTVPADESATTLSPTIATDDDTSTAEISVLEVGELSVTDFEAPADVQRGEEITVSADITNTGDISLTQDVVFTIDGTEQGSREITLSDGVQSVSFSYTVPADESADTLTPKIVTADDAAEADVTVLEKGDFSVKDINAPTDARQGEDITVSADISHSGDVELTQDVVFTINGIRQGSKEVTLDGGDQSVSFTYTVPGDESSDTLTPKIATADDTAEADVSVFEVGEFSVTGLTAPPTAQQGEDINVSADISHSGDVELTQDVVFSIDGTNQNSKEVTLNGGDRTVSFTYTVPGDESSDTLTPKIATADDTAEGDVTVLERGELSVKDINAPTDARQGEDLTVSADISHSGDVELTQDVVFTINGIKQGSKKVTLDGSDRAVSFTYTVPSDESSDTLTPKIATDDDTAEADVSVVKIGELSVTEFNAPTDIQRGKAFTVNADISHTGDVELTQNIIFTVNGTKQDSKKVSLEDGDRTVSFTHTVPADESADTLSLKIATADDTSEEDVSILEVGDLAVTDFTTPAGAKRGENITVSANITNIGDTTVTNDVIFSVDGMQKGSEKVTVASGEQFVSFNYTIPAAVSDDSFTLEISTDGSSASNEVAVLGGVSIDNVDINPTEVGTNKTIHTLSFDVKNISTDGDEDTFSIRIPDTVTLHSVSNLTVGEATTDTSYAKSSNNISFVVNKNGTGPATDLDMHLNMTLSKSPNGTA